MVYLFQSKFRFIHNTKNRNYWYIWPCFVIHMIADRALWYIYSWKNLQRSLLETVSLYFNAPDRTIRCVSWPYTGRRNTDRNILKISRIRPYFHSIRRRIRLYFKYIKIRISAPGIRTVSFDLGLCQ
jgi:hypothetical protein